MTEWGGDDVELPGCALIVTVLAAAFVIGLALIKLVVWIFA